MILLVVKYFLWALTNLLAIAGAWFVKFTEDGPDGRRRLTKWGRIGLPVACVCFVFALIVTVSGDILESRRAANRETQAEQEKKDDRDKIDQLIDLVTALGPPNTPGSIERMRHLAGDPSVEALAAEHPAFRQALDQIASRIGGKPQLIRRLKARDPTFNVPADQIGVLASFSLQHYGKETPAETHAWIIETIRGIEADIIALQEVTASGLERIRVSLPEFESALTETGFLGGILGHAILWRTSRVAVVGRPEIIDGPFVRKPMVLRCSLGDVDLSFVSINLKPLLRMPGDPSYILQRTAELKSIAAWIEALDKGTSIIVAGAFQTELSGSELVALNQLGAFYPTSEWSAKVQTNIPRELRLLQGTHFAVFGEVRGRYLSGSARAYELPRLIPELSREEILRTISDHNPVSMAIGLN